MTDIDHPMQNGIGSAGQADDLRTWLNELGFSEAGVVPLDGDVSTRAYFRVATDHGDRFIAAYYPREAGDACDRFVSTSQLLRDAGVRVPEVVAAACDRGLMLMEDLGPATLYDIATGEWRSRREELDNAIGIADVISGLDLGKVSAINPDLDRTILERELKQTWETYLEPRCRDWEPSARKALREGLEALCEELGRTEQAPCHRDFMARNLIPLSGGGLGLIDHQDLRLGPCGYDLASLLNDSIYVTPELEEELLGTLTPGRVSREGYRRAAAQRCLKIVGTFESFRRQGNSKHVPLIAPSMEAARRHLSRIPETAAMAELLRGLEPRS